jgi:hypothetical protein
MKKEIGIEIIGIERSEQSTHCGSDLETWLEDWVP